MYQQIDRPGMFPVGRASKESRKRDSGRAAVSPCTILHGITPIRSVQVCQPSWGGASPECEWLCTTPETVPSRRWRTIAPLTRVVIGRGPR
jgi:hypothetical protein